MNKEIRDQSWHIAHNPRTRHQLCRTIAECQKVHFLEPELARLRAERDELRSLLGLHKRTIDNLKGQRDELLAACRPLLAKLYSHRMTNSEVEAVRAAIAKCEEGKE